MNRIYFEKFFQKPQGFIWSDDLQCYYEHQDFRFKYTEGSIGEFNLKWQGWLACFQTLDPSKQDVYLEWAFDNISKASIQREWLVHVLNCCGFGVGIMFTLLISWLLFFRNLKAWK